MVRRASTFNTRRIDHLYVDPHEPDARLFLHYGELMDGSRLSSLLLEIEPDEVYNLAAQSHVRVSFDEPEFTSETTGLGTIRLFESIRRLGYGVPLLSSGEFGDVRLSPPPQREETPFHPRSLPWVGEAVRLLVCSELPRCWRAERGQRHLVQPRIPRRGERPSSPGRSRAPSPESRPAWMNTSGWETSMRSATGVMRRSTSKVWRMMQEDEPAGLRTGDGHRTHGSRFPELSFAYLDSTGRSTSVSTAAIFVPLRSMR